jgi:hypothetical protein
MTCKKSENDMKRLMMTGAAALTLLLGGCATTIRSDVTTFQQWPAQMQDKSYAFEAPAPQDDTLELRSYQNLVRGQLTRLGFNEAPAAAALKVSMRFMTTEIPVQVIEPAFNGFYPYGGRFGYYGPRRFGGYYGGPFFGNPYFGGFGGPGYDVYEEQRYQRQLQIKIATNAGQPLFDVTVRNTSRAMSTPALMPALVQSAFEGFPGPNGAVRRIELKQNG